MSTEANKTTIRNWVAAAWNKGDFSSAASLYPASYVFNDPSSPSPVRGPEGIIGVVSMYRGSSSDFKMVIDDMVAEGDKVAWRWTVRGANDGPLMQFPPSGRPFAVTGIVVSRFGNGQWLEDYSNFDLMGLLQHIGAIPAPA
jgi:steroid delta-isomerase-like uncharacterized protein